MKRFKVRTGKYWSDGWKHINFIPQLSWLKCDHGTSIGLEWFIWWIEFSIDKDEE